MRMNACKKQSKTLEYLILQLLLTTSMRESELSKLNVGQYHSKGLHNVVRKGSTKKISIPKDIRELLNQYLATMSGLTAPCPL